MALKEVERTDRRLSTMSDKELSYWIALARHGVPAAEAILASAAYAEIKINRGNTRKKLGLNT